MQEENSRRYRNKIAVENVTGSSLPVTLNPWPIFFSMLHHGFFSIDQEAAENPGIELDVSDQGLFLFAGGVFEGKFSAGPDSSELRNWWASRSDHLLAGIRAPWPQLRDISSNDGPVDCFRVVVSDSRSNSDGISVHDDSTNFDTTKSEHGAAFMSLRSGTESPTVSVEKNGILVRGSGLMMNPR